MGFLFLLSPPKNGSSQISRKEISRVNGSSQQHKTWQRCACWYKEVFLSDKFIDRFELFSSCARDSTSLFYLLNVRCFSFHKAKTGLSLSIKWRCFGHSWSGALNILLDHEEEHSFSRNKRESYDGKWASFTATVNVWFGIGSCHVKPEKCHKVSREKKSLSLFASNFLSKVGLHFLSLSFPYSNLIHVRFWDLPLETFFILAFFSAIRWESENLSLFSLLGVRMQCVDSWPLFCHKNLILPSRCYGFYFGGLD